jgi:hypothetical protein
VNRTNPDLDDFMNDVPVAKTTKRRRGGKRMKKDIVKRYAFRVLAMLVKLDEAQRERVLEMAKELNRA